MLRNQDAVIGLDSRPSLANFDELLFQLFEDFTRGTDLSFHQPFANHGIEAAEIAGYFLASIAAQSGLQVSNDGNGMAG